MRGKTSSGSTPTSPTPTGAGRSWVRSGPAPRYVRARPPAAGARSPSAGPARPWAPQARYEPAPSASHRRPAAPERPSRPLAGAPGSARRRGEGAVPARPPRRPFLGEAQASGWREGVGSRSPGQIALGGHPPLWRPPCPGGRPCFPFPSPPGPGRGGPRRRAGPGAVRELRGSTHRRSGEGAAALSPGRGRDPTGVTPGASRMGPASRALTLVVSLISQLACDTRADS